MAARTAGSATSRPGSHNPMEPHRGQDLGSSGRVRWPAVGVQHVVVVVTGVVVVSIMLGLVALNALLAQTSFRIGDLQTKIGHLTQSYEQRRLQAAQVSSPAHLAKVAQHLGLVVPQGGIVILTPPARITSSSGKAAGGRA